MPRGTDGGVYPDGVPTNAGPVRTLPERLGIIARRALFVAAVAVGLVLGLAAGLFGLAVGGDSTIFFASLVAGAGMGWLCARVLVAYRLRLVRLVGVWLLGRVVPGSRTGKILVAAAATSRVGAPRR